MSDQAGDTPGGSGRLRRLIQDARLYVYRALWEVDESRMSTPVRGVVTLVRLSFVTLDSFFREQLHTRSAALAFFTLLSVIPFAALTFSVAKAVGAYDLLVEETIRPLLEEAFRVPPGTPVSAGTAGLKKTLEELIEMVQDTNVFGLGLVGVVVLLITIRRVLATAEDSFDVIWGFRGSRRFWTRLPGYVVVALWSPLALAFASSMTAARQGQPFMAMLYRALPDMFADLLAFALPPLLVWLAMLPVYVILPGARVRRRSAMIGALIGGLGWYLLQIVHVNFQIGVARQNAIYSGFGAFPIFLLWLHLSWLWVLLGAQVAAVHQNAPTLRQLARPNLDAHHSRQAVALRAMVALAGAEGGEHLRPLAREIGVAVEALREVLDVLVSNRLLRRSGGAYNPRYEAAADPDATRVASVVEAMTRGRERASEMPWDETERPLTEVLERLHDAAESSTHNRTIGELRRAAVRAADETVVDDPDEDAPDAGDEHAAEEPDQAPDEERERDTNGGDPAAETVVD